MSYVEEPDGTRLYSNGYRYRPKTGKVYRKCPPGHTAYRGQFYGPLDVLPDTDRQLPFTRPDEDAVNHRFGCRCPVCKGNPHATWLKRKAAGLKVGARPTPE